MLTPEELAQLEAVVDADDLDTLLAQFYSEGKITLEEAFALQDKQINAAPTPPVPSTKPAVTNKPFDPLAGALNIRDPYLLAYTSANDLAERLGRSVISGWLTLEAAGKIYGQLLGKETDTESLSYLMGQGKPPEQMASENLMAVRAGVERITISQRKEAGAEVRITAASGGATDALLESWLKSQGLWTLADENAKQAAIQRTESDRAKIESEAVFNRIKFAKTVPELLNFLDAALRTGHINGEERNWLYNQYAPDILEGEAKTQENADKTLRNSATIQSNKNNYLPGLKTYLDSSVKNGSITQEQADSQYNLESSFIDKGYDLQDLPNYASLKGMELIQTPEQALGKKAQAEVDIINQANRDKATNRQVALNDLINQSQEAGAKQLLDEYRRRSVVTKAENERPEQPSYAGAAEPFLASLPPNFRAYVQNVIMPRIAEETAGARAEWWKRKNPVAAMAEPAPAPVRTFESLLAGARTDVRERGDVLRGLQLGASTGAQQDYSLGQLPYATEQQGLSQKRLTDLLALGQEGYYAQQRGIPRDVIPEPRTPKPTTEEDPFLARLKQGNEGEFLAKFLMQSPEQRGYNKQRFAPRVQYRGY